MNAQLPNNLILDQFEIGPLQNFLYIIGDKETNKVAVIDPAWDVPFLIKHINNNQYEVEAVFLTHAHPDHINGLEEFLNHFDVPAFLSKHEYPAYKPQHQNIVEIEDQSTLKTGNIEWKVILTPGHSPGCQSFKYKNVLLAGDAIFIDGCGRTDLPGGDPNIMFNTLYNIIGKMDDDTVLYTGHNYGPKPYATLESQKKTNPYLLCSSKDEFVHQRMGF